MGANQGRVKRNEQKAKYKEPGKKTRETRSERMGKTKEAKAEREHLKSHCEAKQGRRGKEETEAE